MSLQIIVIFQTFLTLPTSSQKFGPQNSEYVGLWNDFPALLHPEGIVMLTAENSISVELLTDCLLRFVPSGTVPNTSNLPMSTGHPGIFSSPVTLTRNLLLGLPNLSYEDS